MCLYILNDKINNIYINKNCTRCSLIEKTLQFKVYFHIKGDRISAP